MLLAAFPKIRQLPEQSLGGFVLSAGSISQDGLGRDSSQAQSALLWDGQDLSISRSPYQD